MQPDGLGHAGVSRRSCDPPDHIQRYSLRNGRCFNPVCLGTQHAQPQITVSPAQGGVSPLTITTKAPYPYAYASTAYAEYLAVSGGLPGYTFSLTAGSTLPSGSRPQRSQQRDLGRT
jgi:hypothetical protein